MATTKKPAKPAKPASAKSATKATSSKRVTPLAKPKAPATKGTTKKPAAKKAETKAPAKSKAAATKPATTKATTKKPATKKAETKAPVKSKPTTAKQTATKATPKKPAAKKAETKAPAKSKPAAAKRTTKQADTATPPPVPSKADKKPTTLKSNYGIIRPSGAKTQKAAAKPTATKSRLSDATLEAFRKRLLADRAAIENESAKRTRRSALKIEHGPVVENKCRIAENGFCAGVVRELQIRTLKNKPPVVGRLIIKGERVARTAEIDRERAVRTASHGRLQRGRTILTERKGRTASERNGTSTFKTADRLAYAVVERNLRSIGNGKPRRRTERIIGSQGQLHAAVNRNSCSKVVRV